MSRARHADRPDDDRSPMAVLVGKPVAAYAVLATLWHGVSALVVGGLGLEPQALVRVQMLERGAFVVVTTVLLWVLMSRLAGRLEASARSVRRRLDEADRLWRQLFEANPQPMCVFDIESLRLLAVNDAAIDKYGWTRAEFLTMTIFDSVAPEDREAIHTLMARRQVGTAYGTHRTGALRHRLKDGRIIDVETTSNDIEFGGRHARLLQAIDVTERVVLERERERAVRELRHSELRYRLAASGGHVWDWDGAAGRTNTPATYWQRLGVDPPSADGAFARLEALMHPDDVQRWHDAMHGHIVRRKPYDFDYRIRHADGTWRWFHTQGQAVWDETGRATYMAGTTFDVTDQRRAEASLLESRQELTELSQRLLDQERETARRLAQALHDRLGQTLGSARVYLDVALRSLPPPVPGPLVKLSELVDSAVAQVRDVLVDLRPPLLEAQGLARSLRDEVQRQAGELDDLHVDFAVDDDAVERQRWPDAIEYAAFMIAREAVANALLHARADTVRVTLGGTADRLTLRVRDDGVGIGERDRHGRHGHLGIVGMRERALAVHARLAIDAVPAGGTSVHLTWQRAPS